MTTSRSAPTHHGRTFLGVHPGTKRGVGVDLPARERATYVLGVTGAGKSTLLLGLICQDMRAGRGLCLLDPNGDLVADVITRAAGFGRAGDVLLLDLQDSNVSFGLNLFACANPTDPQAVAEAAERVVAVFKKVWGDSSWGPRMQDLLANAALTLVANPGTTLADLPALLTDAAYRRRLVERLADPVVRDYWLAEYDPMSAAQRQQVIAPVMNKVREFLRHPLLAAIVSQQESSVDFAWAMATNKIVLVRLHPKLEEATNLLGAALVQQIAAAAFDRGSLPRERRHTFMLYADECQRFATPSFVTLLREARKYGVATTAATQMHGLLPPDVATALTNAATIACFQLVPEDARALQGLFTGAGLPRPRVLDPDPLGTLLRGHHDPTLVELAQRVQSALGAYQVRQEERFRQERDAGFDSPLVASHVRQIRNLIAAFLFAAQRGRVASSEWDELRRFAHEVGLPLLVRRLGERLAAAPLCQAPSDAVGVAQALTRLPAFHALVRYRDGTRVTEALVRTLPTRPLRRPVPVRPLGRPRAEVLAELAHRGSEDEPRPTDEPAPVRPSRRRPPITAEVEIDA